MNITLFTFLSLYYYVPLSQDSVALGQSIYSYYTRSFRVTETF